MLQLSGVHCKVIRSVQAVLYIGHISLDATLKPRPSTLGAEFVDGSHISGQVAIDLFAWSL